MKQAWLGWTIGLCVAAAVSTGCITQESGSSEEVASAEQSLIAGYELNGAPATVALGAQVSASFVAPAGHPTTDWVGLYPVGGQTFELLDWVYVPATATGTIALTLPSTATVGDDYELRYYLDNGYEHAASSTPFEAVSFTYSLSNEPAYPGPGTNVTIAWTAPVDHSAVDWVALYPTGALPSGYVDWEYVGNAGITSGTSAMQLPGTALPGETFEFRYNLDNTYQTAATSATFTVGNTLTAPAGPVPPGASVSSAWGAPASHSTTDWIGLFEASAGNTSFVAYDYVGQSGLTTGSVNLVVPATATDGQEFEFRYFLNNTYTLAGRSTSFTVGEAYSLTGPAGPVAPGATIDGIWTAPSFHSTTDWIGLYEVGALAGDLESYAYVGAPASTAGTTQVLVPIATPAGTYELRYNTNNTYNVVATSAPFVVGCPAGTDDCDGNTANGCEANTASDPLNCGQCGSACGVGSCSASSCQSAELLVTGIPTAGGLVSDGVDVFFTSGGQTPLYLDGSVNSIPVGGGTVTTLASGLPTLDPVALDGGFVVFGSYGTPSTFTDGFVARVSKLGGAVDTFAPGQPYALDLAVQGSTYYWVTAGTPAASYTDGAVRASAAGASPTTVAIDTNPAGVFADASFVYWTGGYAPGSSQLDGALRRQPIGGGATEDLVTTLDQPGAFIVVNGIAYIATQDEVNAVDTSAPGSATVFAGGIGDPGQFATDGADLYWTEPGGRVLRQSLSGGPLITLADGLNQPFGIIVEGAYVYFTVRGLSTNDGGVMRILR